MLNAFFCSHFCACIYDLAESYMAFFFRVVSRASLLSDWPIDRKCSRYALLNAMQESRATNCTVSPLKSLPAPCLKQPRACVTPSQGESDSPIELTCLQSETRQQSGAVTRMWRSCQVQPSHKERAIGAVRSKKEGMLLQPLRWHCVDCVTHHERDVREEQHRMYVMRTSNNRAIMACDLYCCLLPQCEALRRRRSGFPIATVLIDFVIFWLPHTMITT